MGGAGKTTIAEQFLHSLPGLFPNAARTTKQSQKLRVPSSVFIYSLYDDDKPANFLESHQMWLEGKARITDQLSIAQVKFLIQNTQGLMVLDGLEKRQKANDRNSAKIIRPHPKTQLA